MVHYFYIVGSGKGETRNVVDIADSVSSRLIMREWNGGDNQLWRWNNDGSLQNKDCRLVISIDKDGFVFVENRKQKSHQQWRIEEGMIRSHNNYKTNLSIAASKFIVSSATPDDTRLAQKWSLIPQALWTAYEYCLLDDNPIIKALIFKEILLEYTECVLGCTLEEYKISLEQCISVGKKFGDKLNEVTKDVGKAKVAGGTAAIVGGAMSVLGLLLALPSAGASLLLTGSGAAIASAGGLTSVGGTITEMCYTTKKLNRIRPIVEKAIRLSTGLRSLIFDVCNEMEKGLNFSTTPRGISLWQMLKTGCATGKTFYNFGATVKKGVKTIKSFKEIKCVAAFVEADAQAVKGATVGLAENTAAGALKVPFTGRVLLQAGSTGAKVFTGTISFFGIVFGILDVKTGAEQIKYGSSTAEELRISIEHIEKEGFQLMEIYNELSKNN